MGTMSYADFTSQQNAQNAQRNTYSGIGYFSLRANKDQALVRFMIDDVTDINITMLHRMTIGGKQRVINCKRGPKEPIANCPFCQADKKLEYRVYLPMLVYERDDQGKVVGYPRVWERSTYYLDTIVNLINTYGPLSNCLFTIIRNGDPGSTSTTYDINYAPPTIYSPETYVKDTSAFEGFNASEKMVIDLTPDECTQVLNGETPERFIQKQEASSSQNTYSQDSYYQNYQSSYQGSTYQRPTPQPRPSYDAPDLSSSEPRRQRFTQM